MVDSDLSRFIHQPQLEVEVVHMPQHTPTVEAAAEVMGTTVEHIAKSLLFLVNGQPVLVIASGTARVDRGKLAAWAGCSKKKVKLADAETVRTFTGFEVGTLPPFGHRQKLRTLIDRRVLDQPDVWAGGGSIDALLRVKPEGILSVTGAEVGDFTNRVEKFSE